MWKFIALHWEAWLVATLAGIVLTAGTALRRRAFENASNGFFAAVPTAQAPVGAMAGAVMGGASKGLGLIVPLALASFCFAAVLIASLIANMAS